MEEVSWQLMVETGTGTGGVNVLDMLSGPRFVCRRVFVKGVCVARSGGAFSGDCSGLALCFVLR